MPQQSATTTARQTNSKPLIAGIEGRGIVTPLGCDFSALAAAMENGTPVPTVESASPAGGHRHFTAPTPTELGAPFAREPRLRRASAVSVLAAVAARAAIAEAGLAGDAQKQLALVFSASTGCAQYTRRFYEQVVTLGASAASPLLFPETVHNAPASHLAAMLGINGATYTLIGDGTTGLAALRLGAELLALGTAERVLVVGAEELDWVATEGHRDWRLLTRTGRAPGAVLAEGAAALVLSAGGNIARVSAGAGVSFVRRRDAAGALGAACEPFLNAALVVDGANGTWVDGPLRGVLPEAPHVSPKNQFGESPAAGGLQQIIAATLQPRRPALVAALGWNQQAAAALVE